MTHCPLQIPSVYRFPNAEGEESAQVRSTSVTDSRSVPGLSPAPAPLTCRCPNRCVSTRGKHAYDGRRLRRADVIPSHTTYQPVAEKAKSGCEVLRGHCRGGHPLLALTAQPSPSAARWCGQFLGKPASFAQLKYACHHTKRLARAPPGRITCF